MKFRSLPLIVSALLMAAHFFRFGNVAPAALCLIAPLLLLIRRRLVLVVLQALTVVAAAIWLLTLREIVQARVLEGRSWAASAMILGTVAGFTLFSGWLLGSLRVQGRYR